MGTSSTIMRGAGRSADSQGFLLRLGEMLHRHGLPSDRLEQALSACATRLGVSAQLFCTPTSLFAAFGEPGRQTTHLVRVRPGEVDLARLAELDALVEQVGTSALTVGRAEVRLRAIHREPGVWGPGWTLAAFALASGTASVFFGAALGDALLALLLGGLIGAMALACRTRPAWARLFEPVAATLASALAVAGAHADQIVTVSALIVLVPGFTLTVAMNELATGHWASGTARLSGAVTSFLAIGLGVALGHRLGAGVTLPALDPGLQLPGAVVTLSMVVAPLCFAVLFGARRRDAPLIVIAGLLSLFASRAGSAALGPELGAAVGALTVGAASNALAAFTRRPALITLVPGLILLVPGSIGFESVTSFLSHDALSGVEAAFRVGMVAVAIVAGLLVAHAIVPARRAM